MMTDNEITVAIAEACGAKIIRKRFPNRLGKVCGYKWAWNGDENTPCAYPGGGVHGFGWNREAHESELPPYTRSLDAVHVAEEVLFRTDDERYIYTRVLDAETLSALGGREWCLAHADARTRCRAILKTLWALGRLEKEPKL
jgi:hypothetical protein